MLIHTNPILERERAAIEASKSIAFTVKQSPKQKEIKYHRRESAAESVGTISKGLERYVLSKGQFSLIEFLEAILAQTGPAHATISTWTAAGSDISEAHNFLTDGRILSCRFLVDFTFHRRKPQFCGQIRQMFGNSAIRVTRNHAKLAVITNDQWKVTVFTSANLNMNPRMEYFLIREDEDLAQFNLSWIDDLFNSKSASSDDQDKAAKWHKMDFQQE